MQVKLWFFSISFFTFLYSSVFYSFNPYRIPIVLIQVFCHMIFPQEVVNVQKNNYKLSQSHYKHFMTTDPYRSAQEMNGQAVFSKAEAESNHVGVNPEEVEVLLSRKRESQQPSFLRALIRAFGPYFLIGSAFKLLQDVIVFVNPQLLR